MIRQKIKDLLANVNKELKKAEAFAANTKVSADEIAKATSSSWSAAGDREHSRGQAEIARENMERLQIFKKEVEESLIRKTPEQLGPICFVKLVFQNGREDEFYLVNSPVLVTGVRFVSVSSPLGRAIANKHIGESFSFAAHESTMTGMVKEIF